MISCETTGHNLVVYVEGELDLHTAPPFKQIVDDELSNNALIQNLILHVDKVSFIDSSGLGVILGRYKLIAARGGHLVFVGCNPQVFRILKLSGMQKISKFVDSLPTALGLHKGGQNYGN